MELALLCWLTAAVIGAGALDMREMMEGGEAAGGHQRSASHATAALEGALFGGKGGKGGGKEAGSCANGGPGTAAPMQPWAAAEGAEESAEVLYTSQRLYLNVSSMHPDKALLCQVSCNPPPPPPSFLPNTCARGRRTS